MPYKKYKIKCPYFPDRDGIIYERDIIEIDSKEYIEHEYDLLLQRGFRRSGPSAYINKCSNCSQCIPIRILVDEFEFSKSQKNVYRKNSDLEIRINKDSSTFITEEKIKLYGDYDFYHNGKKMSESEATENLVYLNLYYPGAWNMEYRLNGRLVGVAVLDVSMNSEGILNGLSSNYFYYETSEEILKRSIGVFSVLKEIELCRDLNIPFYYLGLYLPDCRKMNYKIKYKPYELYLNEKWIRMPENPEAEINTELVYQFPEFNMLKDFPDICFISDDIKLQVLYSAYMSGIFPWFDENAGEPVIWRSPLDRFVIKTEEIHIPKSLKKFIKKSPYTYTFDKCFEEVMKNCGDMKREGQNGTWIGPMMLEAYSNFHKAGFAHSIEVWKEDHLVGGLYGVLIGSIFFGESMFTLESNSSKSAFAIFAKVFTECGGKLIDCQAYTDNMARYNAKEIPREEFIAIEKDLLHKPLTKNIKKTFEDFVASLNLNNYVYKKN